MMQLAKLKYNLFSILGYHLFMFQIEDLIYGISTSSIPLSEYVSVLDYKILSLISLNELRSSSASALLFTELSKASSLD
jgi:hypothetical protein